MTIRKAAAALLSFTALTLAPGVARADDGPAWGPFTANLGVTSDYRFRGQSQAQRDPAIFGGLDYTGASGFFAGVWLSSVDFNDAAKTYLETDLYAGYTKVLDDKTTGSIKAVYYWYPQSDYAPGAAKNDYFELIANLTHDFGAFSGGLELAYSPNYFLETGSSVELAASATIPLTDKFWIFDCGLSASAKLGYQWINDNAGFGTPDYVFYDIGLTGKIGIAALDLRYVGTDLSKSDCFSGTNLCEGGFVATLTFLLPG